MKFVQNRLFIRVADRSVLRDIVGEIPDVIRRHDLHKGVVGHFRRKLRVFLKQLLRLPK